MYPTSPSAKPAEMFRKPSGNGEICLLPSTSRVPPRKISIPARVTMKAGMPK